MRILAWVHLYPPMHCAGAELMLHEILLAMQQRGHTVQVICNDNTADSFEGIPVTLAVDTTKVKELVEWSQIVITHLDSTPQVIEEVAGHRPLVHLVHNDKQLHYHRVRHKEAQLVVLNSEWLRTKVAWEGRNIVLPPPVDASRYKTTPGECVTLINLNAHKGAAIFWELARTMPDTKFLGVIGAYYQQIKPNRIPANATIIDHTPDIRSVYAQTKILLCPSSYESWGRVGIEAAASGIPTIASPTPGLLESLSYAGTFADTEYMHQWQQAIRSLQQPAIYKHKQALALQRSADLQPAAGLSLLESEMEDIVRIWAGNLFEKWR